MAKIIENGPDKVVVIAGPTFGEALRFVAFGFALGAGTVYFLLGKDRNPTVAEPASPTAIDRALALAHRAKAVAEHAKEIVHSVQEAAAPLVEKAVEHGKQVAAEVESRMRHELDDAAKDGEEEPLATETEEKFVE